MVANFNDCKFVIETLIRDQVKNFDSDPETAINFVQSAFRVFRECSNLTEPEFKQLNDLFIDSFIIRFGYYAYVQYFGFEDEPDHSDDLTIFDDGMEYDF